MEAPKEISKSYLLMTCTLFNMGFYSIIYSNFDKIGKEDMEIILYGRLASLADNSRGIFLPSFQLTETVKAVQVNWTQEAILLALHLPHALHSKTKRRRDQDHTWFQSFYTSFYVHHSGNVFHVETGKQTTTREKREKTRTWCSGVVRIWNW